MRFMKQLKKRTPELFQVYYFNRAGASNTFKVVGAVRRRLRFGGISKILVASESGRLALKFRDIIKRIPIVCVTVDEATRRAYYKPALMRDELQKRGIVVVDTISEPISRELVFRNWWQKETIHLLGPSADLFWMTLICVGGHGLRTAVEIVFMAVEAGIVKPRERVIAIGGTGWGADSAIVMAASRFANAVGVHPEKRLKIEEILAMPKQTKWAGYG
jgi:hypothetical protein